MSGITSDQLLQLNAQVAQPVTLLSDALNSAFAAGEITTPLRVAHFLAQVLTETGGLTRMRESMSYSSPAHLLEVFPHEVYSLNDAAQLIASGGEAIANRIYANRIGNGPETSGDGWRYRGGGMLQLTGRSNYRSVGEAIGMDLEAHPEYMGLFSSAAQSAAKFWLWKGCNYPADQDDVVSVTRRINPALQGLDDRKAWLTKTRQLFIP